MSETAKAGPLTAQVTDVALSRERSLPPLRHANLLGAAWKQNLLWAQKLALLPAAETE